MFRKVAIGLAAAVIAMAGLTMDASALRAGTGRAGVTTVHRGGTVARRGVGFRRGGVVVARRGIGFRRRGVVVARRGIGLRRGGVVIARRGIGFRRGPVFGRAVVRRGRAFRRF